jgi:hypothetical protein
MTLNEFIHKYYDRNFPTNAWVTEYGFEGIYVRIGYRYINKERVKCLDIANIKAILTGQGCFTRLIETIQLNFPNLWIFVENVQTSRFQRGLLRLGFIQTEHDTYTACFYLEPLTANIPSIQAIRNI